MTPLRRIRCLALLTLLGISLWACGPGEEPAVSAPDLPAVPEPEMADLSAPEPAAEPSEEAEEAETPEETALAEPEPIELDSWAQLSALDLVAHQFDFVTEFGNRRRACEMAPQFVSALQAVIDSRQDVIGGGALGDVADPDVVLYQVLLPIEAAQELPGDELWEALADVHVVVEQLLEAAGLAHVPLESAIASAHAYLQQTGAPTDDEGNPIMTPEEWESHLAGMEKEAEDG